MATKNIEIQFVEKDYYIVRIDDNRICFSKGQPIVMGYKGNYLIDSKAMNYDKVIDRHRAKFMFNETYDQVKKNVDLGTTVIVDLQYFIENEFGVNIKIFGV